MSNSRRRYRAILTKLTQLHGYPTGNAMQRLQVQAGFISGIVGSKSTHILIKDIDEKGQKVQRTEN